MVEKDRVGGRGRAGERRSEEGERQRTWKVLIRRGAQNNHTDKSMEAGGSRNNMRQLVATWCWSCTCLSLRNSHTQHLAASNNDFEELSSKITKLPIVIATRLPHNKPSNMSYSTTSKTQPSPNM